jgi:2-polyprenyl-3-methyl-5-hydroxy-6-metoxy-1,4-benzoquinol methylase
MIRQTNVPTPMAACGKSMPHHRGSAAEPACIACGHQHWKPLFSGLLQCAQCGFARANLELEPDEIAALYGEKYFSGLEYGDYLADSDVHHRNFERRLDEITAAAGRLESVFEVGCAYGLFLAALAGRGIRCAGSDVCEAAVDYARRELGQEATANDFLTATIVPGEYQAFCMWDTIEHLMHPEQFVARIYDLLPHRGWFFATTGDIGSRLARRRGRKWRMIHPPTHLQYFSAATMRQFLTRRGFEVQGIRSVAYYRNLRSVLANMQILGRGPLRLAAGVGGRVIPQMIQRRVGASLDLGDIMLVCARKP